MSAEWHEHFHDYGEPDAKEWTEGECDKCLTPDEVGPFGTCCACAIGQGASPDECECGPQPSDSSTEAGGAEQ